MQEFACRISKALDAALHAHSGCITTAGWEPGKNVLAALAIGMLITLRMLRLWFPA